MYVNQHLIKHNTKLVEDNNKEQAFRKIWQNVFKITQEEDAQYNLKNEREEVNFLNNNAFYLKTYNHSSLDRLHGVNQIDTLISFQEIEKAIRSFKKNTSGKTNINKKIPSKTPKSALKKLQ